MTDFVLFVELEAEPDLRQTYIPDNIDPATYHPDKIDPATYPSGESDQAVYVPDEAEEAAYRFGFGFGWQASDFHMVTVRDYTRAAGCFVEIENTGQVCTFAPGFMTIEDRASIRPWPDLFGGKTTQRLRVEIPHSGRPIVLLPVGGGNQEFDHWDDAGTICVGQGARCEAPEPPVDYPYALYAKAVFKKKPDDIRMEPVGDANPRFGRRVFDPGRG